MSLPILTTKLRKPILRPGLILRPRLIQGLNAGLTRKWTLVSAPAGYGKSTIVSAWVAVCGRPAAWLSLDPGDSDRTRFLIYLIAALRSVHPEIGHGLLEALQSPQPPPPELALTNLLNQILSASEGFLLVLDDYHVIDSTEVDGMLAFLLEHLPFQMHLVISTREDPPLPLARERSRDQLNELRAADLRFSHAEAAEFLTQVMKLNLSAAEIGVLEARTEGWIAGLQLAALAVRGRPAGQQVAGDHRKDLGGFLQSFSGTHHYIMDYLMEEVLSQQTPEVEYFLLRTSILERMCGPLCDAVLWGSEGQGASGQETLEHLERANLFIVHLDTERRWYRYHHLFAELLRQRLQLHLRRISPTAEAAECLFNELRIRASHWFEENGLALEAFEFAAAAGDIDRADRLIDGKGIPLHFVSPVSAILSWLESLPKYVLDSKPALWWRTASLLLIAGRTDGVEEKLQAAEAALAAQSVAQRHESPNDETRNLMGQIAAARATLALTRYDVETMLAQSRRALEYLDHQSLFTRATAFWTAGFAHLLQGDRVAARLALMEAVALSQKSGGVFTLILATIALGNAQEMDLELHQAAETYRQILALAGSPPQQIIHEGYLGLARILREWNELDAAARHGQQALELARQYDVRVIDRFIMCEVFLARLKLAQGDAAAAGTMLEKTYQSARQRNFILRLPEVAAAQVPVLLKLGKIDTAGQIADKYNLPLSQARVRLARGDIRNATEILADFIQAATARGWQDERLKGLILLAITYQAAGEADRAIAALGKALALAEPGGMVRAFLDEGPEMAHLFSLLATKGAQTGYVTSLRASFALEKNTQASLLIEPLSQREIEILRLVALGLSNQEISSRLDLALDTVKGHNRRIFEKLHVQRRTEAVARARALGLLADLSSQ